MGKFPSCVHGTIGSVLEFKILHRYLVCYRQIYAGAKILPGEEEAAENLARSVRSLMVTNVTTVETGLLTV